MQPFSWPVRVYYEDTDAGGVMYHSCYLNFFERARTEWLRAKGIKQSTLSKEAGIIFTVTEMNIRFRKPARLDDLLAVTAQLDKAGGASFSLTQSMQNEAGTTLATAALTVACLHADTLMPARIPVKIKTEILDGC